MRAHGIQSRVVKKYKATTNSKHYLPVAANLLIQDFMVSKPNEMAFRILRTFHLRKDGFISLEYWIYVDVDSSGLGHG